MDRRELLKTAGLTALMSGITGCASPPPVAATPKPTSVGPAWPTSLQRIAFGSCIDQNKSQPIWAPILAAQPDLFIFGGDNVYASTPPWQLDSLEEAYATQAAQAGFAQLRKTIPHVAIWDDHDMGLNDGGCLLYTSDAADE